MQGCDELCTAVGDCYCCSLQVLAEANVIGSTCTTTSPPADTAKASTAAATSGGAPDDCVDAAGVVVEEQQLLQTPVAGTDTTLGTAILSLTD